MYLFRKTGYNARTVVEYHDTDEAVRAIRRLARDNVGGFFIFDVYSGPIVAGLPCERWGGIVLTSPEILNFENWRECRGAYFIFVNCHTAGEIKAFFAWEKREVAAWRATKRGKKKSA
ncbi:retrotransposon hot spot (RHS) protein [Trypanosoma conorhini]|uniref:Retrotransposon hot spot (RHS) protein n=1 Tax=Trypanosoma conorhini TaxID=83891 RepID=A0A3R7K8L0_9TRYP|nr:retrotransposon hot spot (RHS) protein [Trypanosoma conorhini]RNE95908.1 retrotransposon hot spot (RHS) protein [Trypanosoma conorhini]